MALIGPELEKFISQKLKKDLDALHLYDDKEGYHKALGIEKKIDETMVTKLDQDLSQDTESFLYNAGLLENAHFLSEESTKSHLSAHLDLSSMFPTYVLDPVDGTRELISGLPEWCYSLAYCETSQAESTKNEAWIFNPMTGFSIKHEDIREKPPHFPIPPKPWLGLVSRSEWKAGLLSPMGAKLINLSPRGSIAFKLGLLSAGACDFVFSQKPKRLWDIAAGTILCAQRGLKMYNREGPVEKLDSLAFTGPLLWCDPQAHDELASLLF